MCDSLRQQKRAQPKPRCRTEAIEAYDARTGEKLDSEEVRKRRAKEVRELGEFEVKMEVDESEMRSTPGKKTVPPVQCKMSSSIMRRCPDLDSAWNLSANDVELWA